MTNPLTASQSTAINKIVRDTDFYFSSYQHTAKKRGGSNNEHWFNFHIGLCRRLRRAQKIDPNMRATDLLPPKDLAEVYMGALLYPLCQNKEFHKLVESAEKREELLAKTRLRIHKAIIGMSYDTEIVMIGQPINEDSAISLSFKPANAGIHVVIQANPKSRSRTQEEVGNILLRLGARRVSEPKMAQAIAFELDFVPEPNDRIKAEPFRLYAYVTLPSCVVFSLRGKRSDDLILSAAIGEVSGEEIESRLPQIQKIANNLWLSFISCV